MSVRYTKWPSALAYDEMNNEMMKPRMVKKGCETH